MAWRSSPEAPLDTRRWSRIGKAIFRFVVCIAAVLGITALEQAARVTPTTAALSFLISVLVVSAFWGIRYSTFLSIFSAFAFDYFFVPPIGSFTVRGAQQWVALGTFLITGIIASQLANRARKEALSANERRVEAAAAQERFRDLVNSVEGIVWEADAQTFAFSFVSDQAESILGYPAETWLADPAFWKDHLHPEDRDSAVQFCLQATAEKRSRDLEYRMIAADGSVVWLRDLATVVVESGRASRLRGVMVDIRERKQAEQARQELGEQWKAAFESNPTMYFIVDASGKIVSVNAFGAEQLGYSVGELVGMRVLDVFYEPDRDAVRKHANECFEQPGRMMRWEARKIRKDGTMLWVRETANAVVLKKQPVLLVACENITEQKRAEEAVRRSEKQLRDVIETIPAIAFCHRPDGTAEFVNRWGLEYTGLSAEMVSGDGWQSAIHPDDLDTHLKKWHASMATGHLFENETRHRNAKGEYRWFLLRAVPLRDEEGNILRWYGTGIDVEDRKRAEALLTGEKRILEMVAKGDSLAQILDSLCRLVEEQASGVLASILLIEDNLLRHGGAPSLPKAYTEAIDGVAIGPSVGSCGTAAFRREQVIVEDIATDPLWLDYRAAALPHSLRACWSTPIFSSQGNVIGTFAMYYGEPRSPNPRDQEIIEQITHLAGVVIERKQTQEALGRSEAYLAEAQRLSKTGSWAYNPLTGKTIYWSAEMFRIFGVALQEGPSSERFWQLVHPEDQNRVRERVEREAHEKKEYVDEYRIVLADGTIKHILDIGHPVFDDGGYVVEYVGTTVDVTERKRAEEELRRSEAYLAEAQKLTKTGSLAWDPVSHKTFHCSDEVFRMFGLDPQKGMPAIAELLERVHPEDREYVTGRSRKDTDDKGEPVVDYRVLLPGGILKYIHSIRHPVLNEAGEIVEFMGTLIDVTEEKRAEAELHAAETRFRTYVDHATDVLFVHDEQGRIVDMNRQACESLGYAREELIGALPVLFDPDMNETFTQRFKERLEAGDLVTFESTNRRKDGTAFPVEVRVSPFLHGGHRFALSLARDISERKRAEAERERLRQIEADLAHINRVSMMGELTASLAHEIKQPIAAAVSNAEASLQWLARDHPDLVEVREAAREMVKEARRAAEIITRVRSLFKKEEIKREAVDLNEVITDTVFLIREEADRNLISVRTELDAELPPISADRVQLQQVLINLMLNGLEAMKDSSGELTIRSQRDEEGRPLISVSDVGIGLPVGQRDKIFDAFFTTKPQGTGMGLAISRSIIESHGGRLWARANSGHGATFHFTLPGEVTEGA